MLSLADSCFRHHRAVHARRAHADHIGIFGVWRAFQLKMSRLSCFSGGGGGAGVEASNASPFTVFSGTLQSKTSRLPLFYQSMHVRTMITSVLPEHACPRDDNVRVTRARMSARS